MTVTQLTQIADGVTLHSIRGKGYSSECFVVIPSVGAIAHIPTGNETDRIETITVHTKAYEHGEIPGVEIRTPFRGTVGTGLSFERGPVSRQDIETHFGIIHNYATNLLAIVPFSLAAQPYWWNTPWGTEELWYPDKGITFCIKSNEVMSFKVYTPHEGKRNERAGSRRKVKCAGGRGGGVSPANNE